MLGIFLAVYIASLDEVPLILLGTVKSNSLFSGPKQQRGKADIFPYLQKNVACVLINGRCGSWVVFGDLGGTQCNSSEVLISISDPITVFVCVYPHTNIFKTFLHISLKADRDPIVELIAQTAGRLKLHTREPYSGVSSSIVLYLVCYKSFVLKTS